MSHARRWRLREAADDAAISASTLPWWRLQLVCPAYRARLTHYATRAYRHEQQVLRHTPERVTCAAGKQGDGVMAQYVRLPRRENNDDENADEHDVLAWRHPSSIIARSSLATLRASALCALPPADSVRARAEQERYVNAQLRACRAAVRSAAAATTAAPCTPRHVRADDAKDDDDGHTTTSAQQLPQLALSPPPSPHSQHRGVRVRYYQAAHATTTTTVAARVVVSSPLSTTLDSGLGAYYSDKQAAAQQQQQQQQQRQQEQHEQPDETLCVNAVQRGCVDHVYGLSYYWSQPLPPAGYIRVAPDPQYAMWPDDSDASDDDDSDGCDRQSQHTSSCRCTDDQHTCGRHRRRHRDSMLRLAAEVNRRNAFMRMLREHDCHVPLQLLRMPVVHDAPCHDRSAAARQQQQQRRRRPLHALQPCYDGVAYINVVATLPAAAAKATTTTTPPHDNDSNNNNVTRRDAVVAVYRQSLWLILYKLYCYALHSEARERRARQRGVAQQQQQAQQAHGDATHTRAHHDNKRNDDDDDDAVLLRDVPHVTLPVTRVQRGSPPLRTCAQRHTPDLRHVQPASSWLGLSATPPRDRNAAAHVAWHYLHHTSLRARQALRDVFACLPHDGDGRLGKAAYTAFVRALLHLFFPLHVSSRVHAQVAAEAWTYRGCVDDVGFDTFYEAFFAVPFIFMRDVARVSEDDYVDFWTLVRTRLYTTPYNDAATVAQSPQQQQHDAVVVTTATAAPQPQLQEQHDALLARSYMYALRRRRLHTRHCNALSAIEATASSWSVHAHDVYYTDSDDDNNDDKTERSSDRDDTAMLRFFADVSDDVFDTRVSLRERYRVHDAYAQLRAQRHAAAAATATSAPPTLPSVSSASRPALLCAPPCTTQAMRSDRNTHTTRTHATLSLDRDTVARLRARKRREQHFLSQR